MSVQAKEVYKCTDLHGNCHEHAIAVCWQKEFLPCKALRGTLLFFNARNNLGEPRKESVSVITSSL